jgi:ribosomal protein S18 acetylase RimI-like enzyme
MVQGIYKERVVLGMVALKKEIIKKDEWLSKIMGKAAYAVIFQEQSDPELIEVMKELKILKRSFITAKIQEPEIDFIVKLKKYKFNFISTDYHLEYTSKIPLPIGKIDDVYTAGPADEPEVVEIAGNTFNYDRFHQDSEIDFQIADQIKINWVKGYFSGKRGVVMYVAKYEHRVTGFLLVDKLGDDRYVIDLIGVRPDRINKGDGRKLIDSFVASLRRDKREVTVGVTTQAANIRALKFYLKCGFEIKKSIAILHLHKS